MLMAQQSLDVVDIDGAVDMASTLQVDGDVTTDGRFVGKGAVGTVAASTGVFTGRSTGGGTMGGRGSSKDISILNKNNAQCITVPTGTNTVEMHGAVDIAGDVTLGDPSVTGSQLLIEGFSSAENQTSSKIIFQNTTAAPSDEVGGEIRIDTNIDRRSYEMVFAVGDSAVLTDALTINGVDSTATFAGTITGNGSGLTALNGSNISSGTVAAARVATLNQNTTGSAATLTTARTIGGTSFNGSANIAVALAATATKLAATKTIAGVAFDGSANISLNNNAITNGAGYTTNTGDITGVTAGTGLTGGGTSGTVTLNVGTLNQNTTGSAATLTTARTIAGVSFSTALQIYL